MKISSVLIILLIALLIISGFYYLGKKGFVKQNTSGFANLIANKPAGNFSINLSSTTPTNTTSPTTTPIIVNANCPVKNTDQISMDTKNKILQMVQNKNYAFLETYMKDKIYFQKNKGPINYLDRSLAIKQLSFLDCTTDWNFADNSGTAYSLIRKDPGNFRGALIGTTPDKYMVSFQFTGDKISTIIVSEDYMQLL